MTGYDGTLLLENLPLGAYTFTYKVVDIKIINPNDVNAILIRKDRDLVTLLTCHPYGSGGLYRYLVFCERVKETAPANTSADTLQQQLIIPAAIQDSSDLYRIAGYHIENQIVACDEVSVPLCRKGKVPRTRTALRHLAKTQDLLREAVIILQRRFLGQGIQIIHDV